MCCVAGVLLFANMAPWPGIEIYDSHIDNFGWPNTAATRHEDGTVTYYRNPALLNGVTALLMIGLQVRSVNCA